MTVSLEGPGFSRASILVVRSICRGCSSIPLLTLSPSLRRLLAQRRRGGTVPSLTRRAVVEAVGTQFNVYERADATRVSVVEGRVQISERGSKPALLGAGEEANVLAGGEIARHPEPDVASAVAWRQRRLTFHGATLAEVVQEFNRYNELRLRIEGDGALGRRVTAVFNADEPEALLEFLAREPNVTLERDAGTAVIRVHRDTDATAN